MNDLIRAGALLTSDEYADEEEIGMDDEKVPEDEEEIGADIDSSWQEN